MSSWRNSSGELADRVRRDSGHGRPRSARHRDRGPGARREAARSRRRQHGGRARRRRTSTALASTAAEELLWAERSEMREAGDTTLFVDVVAPAPRLIVFGAVDYAAALCRLARAAGWRPSSATRVPSSPRRSASPTPRRWSSPGRTRRSRGSAASTAPPTSPSSRTTPSSTTRRSRSRFARTRPTSARWAAGARRPSGASACWRPGVEEELLERIAAPIGLDLGAVSPEETALSIMAEVVAVRNGRDGGRLSHAAGRIHEVGA